VTSAITALRSKVDKLLHLYYANRISDDTFASEEARLRVQIASLESEALARRAEQEHKEDLAERFEDAAEVLASFGLEEIWDEATADERRTIIEDLLDWVYFYPDQLMVQVLGAPPILLTLEEAGLRVGTRSVVSEGGLETLVHSLSLSIVAGQSLDSLPGSDGSWSKHLQRGPSTGGPNGTRSGYNRASGQSRV
jgi:hypothetical protein